MILHGYFRSTASWRVRIALALKGLEVENRYHHLRKGEQRSAEYLAINPQGLLPALVLDDGAVLTQSLAIIEYLDEVYPEPRLLPSDPVVRAHARSIAQLIACDVHPLQNLKVLARVRTMADESAANEWARQVIGEGLDACETLLQRYEGPFCLGAEVTLADLVLVPQLGNVRRFGMEIRWPRIAEIEKECLKLEAFRIAAPDQQPDSE